MSGDLLHCLQDSKECTEVSILWIRLVQCVFCSGRYMLALSTDRYMGLPMLTVKVLLGRSREDIVHREI